MGLVGVYKRGEKAMTLHSEPNCNSFTPPFLFIILAHVSIHFHLRPSLTLIRDSLLFILTPCPLSLSPVTSASTIPQQPRSFLLVCWILQVSNRLLADLDRHVLSITSSLLESSVKETVKHTRLTQRLAQVDSPSLGQEIRVSA